MVALLARWRHLLKINRKLRQGQALFNALYELHPELGDEIRGTDLDCFYDDKRIPAVFDWVGPKLVAVGEGKSTH